MTSSPPKNAEGPNVGDEIVVPVLPSPSRISLFPDQAVVVSMSPGTMEFVLLRQEVVIKSQRGTVLAQLEDTLNVEFSPHQVRPELFDIGHVRLTTAAAIDMALAVIAQAVSTHSADYEELLNRLHSLLVESK